MNEAPNFLLLLITDIEGDTTPNGQEKDMIASIVRKKVNSTKRSINGEYLTGIAALIRDLVSEKPLIGIRINGLGFSSS